MERDAKIILQRIGIEVKPDDQRPSHEILNELNRARIAISVAMEPDENKRAAIEAFARDTYPLAGDEA